MFSCVLPTIFQGQARKPPGRSSVLCGTAGPASLGTDAVPGLTDELCPVAAAAARASHSKACACLPWLALAAVLCSFSGQPVPLGGGAGLPSPLGSPLGAQGDGSSAWIDKSYGE